MNRDNLVIKEHQIDYNVLRLIKDHAKKYETATDKKEFLRNVCAYEQKLILLNSKKPYEVLCYLESLNLKSSRLILNELNFQEISEMLYLFTPEDKESFYKHFSDLELVNQFITCDKGASRFIKDLPLDRKVDLINSSKDSTVKASETVYETISTEKRAEVMQTLTSADGVSALSNTDTYQQDAEQEQTNADIEKIDELENQEQDKDIKNKAEKETKEEPEKEKDEQLNNAINDFLKANLEMLKQKDDRFESIDINAQDIFLALSPDLQAIVQEAFDHREEKKEELQQEEEKELDIPIVDVVNDSLDKEQDNDITKEPKLDIEGYKKYSIIGDGEKSASIVTNPNVVQSFNNAAQACEQDIINQLKREIQKENPVEETVKTL